MFNPIFEYKMWKVSRRVKRNKKYFDYGYSWAANEFERRDMKNKPMLVDAAILAFENKSSVEISNHVGADKTDLQAYAKGVVACFESERQSFRVVN